VRANLSFWLYLPAGALGWYGFQDNGLRPALGLLPIIPAIPKADSAFGIFSEAEQYPADLRNHIKHSPAHLVEIVLFSFG